MEKCVNDIMGCIRGMSLSDASSLTQTAIIILGFYIAFKQFRRWHEEIAHDRRVDLAMQLGEMTYRFQREFKVARDSWGRYKEGTTGPQETWTDLVRDGAVPHEELEYDRKIRIEKVFIPLTEMRILIWQTSLIFDPDLNPSVSDIFKEFESLCEIFAIALYDRDAETPATYSHEEALNIATDRSTKDSNSFGSKIDAATENMREAIKKVTLGHKSKRKAGGLTVKPTVHR